MPDVHFHFSSDINTSMQFRTIVSVFTSLACTHAAVIDHDTVVPFAQPTPTTTLQTLAVQYKPQIYIANGCHPYLAVDEDGNTSGGLKPTGSQSAGCKGSGYGSQIYGRAVEYEGVYAFMYSWYMPKDETLPGLGHRHDWEACVVWLDSLDDPNVVALSASYHSTYLTYYPPDSDYLDGDSAKIEYSTSWVILDHSLSATSTSGETQDLIM
ncbi:NLP effector protein 1 [Phytophthora oleae]|uniref:NLP effector protein 1 n=1 Tax=Phytophthora oleae TaxID=2107226 RepID=A0ABD3ESW8_9STRA